MDIQLINDTKAELSKLADILYKGNVDEGISGMNEVIPGIAAISTWVSDESLQRKLIDDALSPLLDAMQQKDATAMADIISYELLDILGQLTI